MHKRRLPAVSFQRHAEAAGDSWHSVLISLLRGLAAVQVAAAHLRSATYPGLRTVQEPALWFQGFAFITGFAHQAVLAFFVISGWLVGGSLLNRIGQADAIASYAIDRVTRLWSVLVPTFVLTLIFGLGAGLITADGIAYAAVHEYSAAAFAGNLVGLQTIAVDNFGGNFALWSLANETWYYVMFPLLVALFAARSGARRLACGAALAVLAAALPYAITLYFAIWLLGAAFSRIRIDCGRALRCALVLLLAAVSVYYRLTGYTDDLLPVSFGQDLVCSLLLLVFLASLQFKAAPRSKLVRPLARVGSFFADFSFSLYVLHVPLIGLMLHWGAQRFGLHRLSPAEPQHFAIYGAMLAILLVASWLFYRLFEAQTCKVRRLAKRRLLQRRPPARAPSVLRAD